MGLRTKQDWEKRLSEFFPRLKPKIGIGLEKSARINLEDLEICKDFCVPIIVGEKEKEIKKDYETISTSPFSTGKVLIDLLKEGEIHGIVKFDTDGITLRNLYMENEELHGGKKLSYLNRCSIVSFEAKEKNSSNKYLKTVLLYPISPEEGNTQHSLKQGLVEAYKELLLFSRAGEKVCIGLLSLCRRHTYENNEYDSHARSSFKEMEELASDLNKELPDCFTTHHDIEVESALTSSDIICAYRGGYGRLVYRTLIFAGAESFEIASPSLVAHAYVGGTKNVNNLLMRIKYAVAKYGAMYKG